MQKWAKYAEGVVTRDEVLEAFAKAADSMGRLNRNAARLMHRHGAHAATDVTGFGLIGHARNLAANQRAPVRFHLHTLPILRHMAEV